MSHESEDDGDHHRASIPSSSDRASDLLPSDSYDPSQSIEDVTAQAIEAQRRVSEGFHRGP